MPDTLYELVEENANFNVRERTETKPTMVFFLFFNANFKADLAIF